MTRWCAVPILGALFSGCEEAAPEPVRTMQVDRVVRDFLAEPGSWEIVRAHPEGKPQVEVICPSYWNKTDGVDMPALVVSPPGEVRLLIGDEGAAADPHPLRLVARAGVDQFTFRKLNDEIPKGLFAFEVRAGERVLVRQVIELDKSRHRENAWVDLGGREGIDLAGAREVTLRTEVMRADGSTIELRFPVRMGFGNLQLVRRAVRERTRSSPEQPNVVLVVMDTLRVDHLSTYGYERPTSPNLTALAARGVLFEKCYSTASWTWPATASILTGLTTMEHGLVGESSSYLFEQSQTVAESMQMAGFTTVAWSGNPIVGPRRNFDQGFESFHGADAGDFRETATFFEEVRAFLRREQGTRFFLYVHMVDPHAPHDPLDEGARLFAPEVPLEFRPKCTGFWRETRRGRGIRPGGEVALDGIVSPEERVWSAKLYDASIWSGDHWLGELVAELAALGLDDETLVAFTSDHGEELFERGVFGHGHSLKQELVRVPLVIAGPDVPAGKRHSGMVSSRMIAPLLARLAGVDFGDGEEALRILAQPERGEDFLLFTTTKGWWKGRENVRIVGLTDGKWKLNLALDGAPWGATAPAPDGDLELYDLERDPLEREDLAASRSEEAARLRALLHERLAVLEARRIGIDVPAGEATMQMLKELGYAGDDEH